VSSEAFLVVKIQIEVFLVVVLCCVAVRCQHFREPCCLHLQGEMSGTGKGDIYFTLKMKTARFSETLASYCNTTQCQSKKLQLEFNLQVLLASVFDRSI